MACRKQLKSKEKQEWTLEKPKLDNARKPKGMYFVDPEDEYKETIKNARRKIEVPMEAAMFLQDGTRKRALKLRETAASENTNPCKKTKYVCTVEAYESTRRRLECTLPKNHEDHVVEKGLNSFHHCNLVHKFLPMPQPMKISGCDGCSGKRMGEARENPSVVFEEGCYS